MTHVAEILRDMFGENASDRQALEAMRLTPAVWQVSLHESYVELLHTVHSCEAWERTEDRIDAAVRRLGDSR